MTKGFLQKQWVYFIEKFPLVPRIETIRLVVTSYYNCLQRIDYALEEEEYVNQLASFEVTRKEHMVYRLKKALYRLK